MNATDRERFWARRELKKLEEYGTVTEVDRPDHPERSCANCGHSSDCATHNEPAMPSGPCNCGKGKRS